MRDQVNRFVSVVGWRLGEEENFTRMLNKKGERMNDCEVPQKG